MNRPCYGRRREHHPRHARRHGQPGGTSTAGCLHSDGRSPTTLHAPPRRFATVELLIVLGLLLFSGAINFVLLKCLFAEYGEAQSFFVSQGINVIYIVYGGLCLYPRLLPCGVGDNISAALGLDPITPARSPPTTSAPFSQWALWIAAAPS